VLPDLMSSERGSGCAHAPVVIVSGLLQPTPQRAAGTRLDRIRWLHEDDDAIAAPHAGEAFPRDGATTNDGEGQRDSSPRDEATTASNGEGPGGESVLRSAILLLKGLAHELSASEGGDGGEEGGCRWEGPELAVPRQCMIACYEGDGVRVFLDLASGHHHLHERDDDEDGLAV
jgi:hypothetical protein